MGIIVSCHELFVLFYFSIGFSPLKLVLLLQGKRTLKRKRKAIRKVD